uniref:ThiF domain-containing protein n=1 Tax=Caenorhabditis japonica TaxID=281687 RepID=A0A8R1HWX5_CAEJA
MTTTASQNENLTVSRDELAVYDRQIRLWGMEAQNKLRNAKVLLIGGTQLGAEVAKTMSLAGVDEMHLVDHRIVDTDDIGANFLYNALVDNTKLTKWAAGYEFLYNLNRNVKLVVNEEDLLAKSADDIEEYVRQFTIVIVLDESYERTVKINEICHKHQIRFIAGSIFGWVGYAFLDFDGHRFLTKVQDPSQELLSVDESKGEANKPAGKVVDLEEEDRFEPKTFSYPSFVEAFNSDFSSKKVIRKCKRVVPPSYFLVKSMLRASKENVFTGDETKDIERLTDIWQQEVVAGNHTIEMQTVKPEKFDHLFGPDFAPTAACVGGMIGQEAIKTISEGKMPIRNLFIYSALDTSELLNETKTIKYDIIGGYPESELSQIRTVPNQNCPEAELFVSELSRIRTAPNQNYSISMLTA